MLVADPAFRGALVAALHADEEFVLETRWFDGSILIEVGDQRCWLKVYRGQVIETFDHVPVFGYSFKVSGSPAAWDMLVTGERTFTDLSSYGCRYLATEEEMTAAGGGNRPPEIAVEGDGFVAGRLHIAILRLARCIATTANDQLAVR